MRDESGAFRAEHIEQIKFEIGDVLWYAACLASELGLKLADAAEANLAKLRSRAERDTLKGEGDHR